MGEVDEPKTDEVPQVLHSQDFRSLACLFGLTKQDGILAQDIYLFFLDPSQAEDLFQPAAENIVDEYLESLPKSISETIYLIKCPVSEEELHKLSLSRIYPWSLTERLGRLPALVRLDGARRLEGSDLTDFAKLHLLFSKTQPRRTAISLPRSGGEATRQFRGVILNLSQGLCSLHGRHKPLPARPVFSECYEGFEKTQGPRGQAEKKPPQRGGGWRRRDSLAEVMEICASRQVVEVERRRQPEPPPVLPPPPLTQPQLKSRKKKKKGKKGKGKGKKGKGKGKGKGKKK